MQNTTASTPKHARIGQTPWLRLISGSTGSAPETDGHAMHWVCGFELKAIVSPAPTEVRPEPWHSFISQMAPDQALRLRLCLQPNRSASGQPPVEVALLSRRALSPEEALQHPLGAALQATWPMLRFGSCDERASEAPRAETRYRYCLTPRPGVLGRILPGSQQPPQALYRVPYPENCTGVWLVAGGQAPLVEGRCELQLVFRSASLSEPMRQSWTQALRGLRQGTLQFAGAEGSEALPPPAGMAEDRLQTLLRAWLGERARGYSVAAEIHCDQRLSAWALDRLAVDLFGSWPVAITEHPLATDEGCPIHPVQGMGSWMLHPNWLDRKGLPSHPAEPVLLPSGPGIVMGHTSTGQPVLLPAARRTEHALVVGGSGTGKSTLLCRLMAEDIHSGNGVVLIDPHGDLFERVLELVPAQRASDVVVMDIGDPDCSVAINPLEGTQDDAWLRDFMSEQIVELTERLFEGPQTSGPVLRNHLRHVLLLAMAYPGGGTLADAARLLHDSDFRDYLLTKAEPRVRAHFKSFERTQGETGFANWVPYLTARLDPFVRSEAMLATLSRPGTVSLEQALHERKIVLIRLGRDLLSENECRILGTLLLLSCFKGVLRRDKGPRKLRLDHPCQLVCDEFHLFVTPAVSQMFREARKFGLGLTVATQSLSSLSHPMSPGVMTDVLANTGAKLFFRMAPKEAAIAEDYTEPVYPAARLANLPNHHAVLSLPAAGVPPVGLTTMLPQAPTHAAGAELIRQQSAHHHATPMDAARRYLVDRHDLPE